MNTRTGLLLYAVWIMLAATARPDDSPMRTVVYPVLYGDPAALETISRSVVGEEGQVVLDTRGNRLIIVTTPARHRQLDEVLGQADAVPGNVQINVTFRSHAVGREQEVSVQGRGGVSVKNGHAGGTLILQPEIRNITTETTGNAHQMLLAASGRSASLKIGEEVPYIDWISEYGWRGGYTETQIRWREVGSFLVVTPTILSDGKTINIKLTPELRGLVDGNPYRVAFTSLSTEVIVRDGATLPLGGFGEHQDFYSRFLVGKSRTGTTSALDIELTPRILPATGM